MIKPYYQYDKIIKCIILFVIFTVFTLAIKYYFKPFAIILVIVLTMNPVHKFMTQYFNLNIKLSALITILIFNIIFMLSLVFIGNFIIVKVNYFIINDSKYFINNINALLMNVSVKMKIDLNVLNAKIQTFFYSIINSELFKKGAAYTTDGIMAYFIGNIAAYFIFIDKMYIIKFVAELIPSVNFNKINKKIKDITNIIKIEVLLVIVTMFLTIIGFKILSINNPLTLGIICGILDIIPIVGTVLVFIPLIILEFINLSIYKAIGLIFMYILLQIVRQILEAKFISKSLNIHPISIIIAVYIGFNLFGILGLFVGPLYVISAKELLASSRKS